jgi:hypothetical protein
MTSCYRGHGDALQVRVSVARDPPVVGSFTNIDYAVPDRRSTRLRDEHERVRMRQQLLEPSSAASPFGIAQALVLIAEGLGWDEKPWSISVDSFNVSSA